MDNTETCEQCSHLKRYHRNGCLECQLHRIDSWCMRQFDENEMPAPKIIMNRVWAMPSASTFTIKPIRELVKRYVNAANVAEYVTLDPFARDCGWAMITNDLNPDTAAQYHLPALDFLLQMVADDIKSSLVLFDPPYSLRQVKEVYQSIGIETMKHADTHGWGRERAAIGQLVVPGGHCLSFGWNSQGMGMKNGFQIIEVLLVAHGRDHNDTICTVERKIENKQDSLF